MHITQYMYLLARVSIELGISSANDNKIPKTKYIFRNSKENNISKLVLYIYI